MKKILFALAIMPLLAIGCSSDDDDDFKNPSDIDFAYNIELLYGEWRATEVDVTEGLEVDLTEPVIELTVAPTYVTFAKGGAYQSKGVLGDGTGKYITKDKTVTTTVGDKKVSFVVKSLSDKSAKIEIDAKELDLPMIPEGIKTVVVELTKDYKVKIDFEIKSLYGKWQATAVVLGGAEIDITKIIEPTFVSFDDKGIYTSTGILGDGTGKYAVKGDDIATMVDGTIMSFEMEKLEAKTAKIKIDASALDLDIIPEGTKEVIVILTKQEEK